MANDFSGDSNCKALWRFENGALTTDSKGTNTLTDYNTVGTSTGDYKEGSACADLELGNSEGFYIADASLNSGVPLKSGESNNVFSVCFWIKPESLTTTVNLFGKWNPPGNKRSFSISLESTVITTIIGYNSGVSFEYMTSAAEAITLSTGTWYHVGFTYNGGTKAWYIKIWDDGGSSVHHEDSGTTTNSIAITDAFLGIGVASNSGTPYRFFDGLIDEVVYFDDILSEPEIDLIRQGLYPGATTTTTAGPTTTTTTAAPTTTTTTTAGPTTTTTTTTAAPTTTTTAAPTTTTTTTTAAPTTTTTAGPTTTTTTTTSAPTTTTTAGPTTTTTTAAPTTTTTTTAAPTTTTTAGPTTTTTTPAPGTLKYKVFEGGVFL